MPFLTLPVLLLCCVTPFMARACSVSSRSDGMHVHCTQGSQASLPDQSPDDVVWLDWTQSQLTSLPDLPLEFLSHVQHLDVSHNAMTELNQTTLRGAEKMQSLDVSFNLLRVVREGSFGKLPALNTLLLHHNHLTWLADDAFLGLSHLRTLNLQNNNLTSLSAGAFRGLKHLTSLDLSHNRLETLDNNTFADLISLTYLTVGDNCLTRLEPLAFVGLNLLTKITLDRNHVQFQHTSLPRGVFAPLKSVEVFSLVDNTYDSSDGYPEGVFNDLVSVRYLSIDSFFHLYFGSDFSQMSAIDTLDLRYNCQAHLFSNNTFFGFKNSSLRTIVAQSCKLVSVDRCAFCDLPQLKYLNLGNNGYLKPKTALLSLYGLQGQTMEEIYMGHIGRMLSLYYTIDRENTKYLKHICVRRFILAMSHLQRWEANAVLLTSDTEFARCIEHIDISENHITGDALALFYMLSLYKNLTTFLLQEQKVYSLKNSACILSDALECENRGHESPDKSHWPAIPMPPRLRYMNCSSSFSFFNSPPSVIQFQPAADIRILDLSYGAFSHCLTTIVGLDQLETLDFSGNYCDKISDNLFDHLPLLKHLYLSNSHLTVSSMRTRGHRLLKGLTRLETLDLSRNWQLEIEGGSLPRQEHLQTLLLSYNSFQSLPVNVDLHPNLTVLDLSFNDITSLTSSERSSLDTLASRRPVRLQLQGNPLSCTCSNLDFLQWLWDTKVALDGEGNSTRRYSCTADTGELTDTERLMSEWQFLWRRCIGQRMFGWTLAAFLVQILGLLTTFMISRSWTHLKYAWNVLRRLRMPTRHDFRKDVYIAYADEDARMACVHLPQCLQGHGIRFLLRHQEELPGSVMADNIVQFTDDSWKVLLLVTRAFAEDDWSCGFTVHQAQRSITDTLPHRVLVVFLEDPRHLPPMASLEKLLRRYSERHVFHVPRDAPVQHPVWDRLARAILE